MAVGSQTNREHDEVDADDSSYKDFEDVIVSTPKEIKYPWPSGWIKFYEMAFNGTTMYFYKNLSDSQIYKNSFIAF